MSATEEIIRVLEEDLLPFTPSEVAVAAHELGIEGDIRAIASEVVEEGVRRSMEAVRGLKETFGELPYPDSLLEERLRKGGWFSVTLSQGGLSMYGLEGKGVQGQEGRKKSGLLLTDGEFTVPTRDGKFTGSLYAYAWPGVPRVYLRNLYATRGRVFFKDYGYRLKKGLDNVRALRPLFASLGLSDLERAMGALAGLEDGEARMEGDYVLARSGEVYALRKGGILGDPRLDGAVLLGKSVKLSFPGDVEVAFRTMWGLDTARLEWAHIRLGEEGILLHGRTTSITPLHKNPLVSELQGNLVRELEKHQGEFSPRTLAFLRAFARHEDPLRALAEGRFQAYVTAEFFFEV